MENDNARVAVETAERALDDPTLAEFLGGVEARPPYVEDDIDAPAPPNAIGTGDDARDDPVLIIREDGVAKPPERSIENGNAEDAAIDIDEPGDDTDDRSAERIPPNPQEDTAGRAGRCRRAQHHTPTTMVTGIVLSCIASVISRSIEPDAGTKRQARLPPWNGTPLPAPPPCRAPSPPDVHSAADLELRARSWRPSSQSAPIRCPSCPANVCLADLTTPQLYSYNTCIEVAKGRTLLRH